MKLCKCGCGKEVKTEKSEYVLGHSNRSPEVKEKKRLTFLAKYGVDNPSKNSEVQKKKMETSIRLHGTESPNQSQDIKNKKKKVFLERYGVENPNQLESIKKKKIHTCLQNYGVQFPMQSNEIYLKGRETLRKNYGVDRPYQSDKIREKGLKTCFDNLNVDNPSKSDIIKKKKLDSEILHFGEPFHKTFDARMMHRENFIKSIEDQKLNGEPLSPRIGENERSCLDELQKYTNKEIKRNIKIIGYFADGYIEDLNLVIEFDEIHHNWTYQKEMDNKKDADMKIVNKRVFRINYKEWQKDKQSIIEKFKTYLVN